MLPERLCFQQLLLSLLRLCIVIMQKNCLVYCCITFVAQNSICCIIVVLLCRRWKSSEVRDILQKTEPSTVCLLFVQRSHHYNRNGKCLFYRNRDFFFPTSYFIQEYHLLGLGIGTNVLTRFNSDSQANDLIQILYWFNRNKIWNTIKQVFIFGEMFNNTRKGTQIYKYSYWKQNSLH